MTFPPRSEKCSSASPALEALFEQKAYYLADACHTFGEAAKTKVDEFVENISVVYYYQIMANN